MDEWARIGWMAWVGPSQQEEFLLRIIANKRRYIHIGVKNMMKGW